MKTWLRLVILVALVIQLVGVPNLPTAATAPRFAMPRLDTGWDPAYPLNDALGWLRSVFSIQSSWAAGEPPPTNHNSPSTPWTTFTAGVNVVSGNLVQQQTDLAIPSTGFPTTIDRTYNSAAAGRPGTFGYGWFWGLGMQVITTTTGVTGTGSMAFHTGLTATAKAATPVTSTVTATTQATALPTNTTAATSTSTPAPSVTRTVTATRTTLAATQNLVSPGPTNTALNRPPTAVAGSSPLPAASSTATASRVASPTANPSQAPAPAISSPMVGGAPPTAVAVSPASQTVAPTIGPPPPKIAATILLTATVIREDGRADAYVSTDGGPFAPPAGIYDLLAANLDGSYTLTRKDQVRYTFSPNGALALVTDPNNNALQVNYTGGNPSSLTDTAGRTWSIQTDGSGRITRVTDPAGRFTQYAYSGAGDLIQVTDPMSGQLRFAYDPGHRMTQTTDPNNHSATWSYDGLGRALTVTGPVGERTSFAYDTGARRTTVTDPRNFVRSYNYDTAGRVTLLTDALGFSEAWEWDASNNRTRVTNRRNQSATFVYDARGNIALSTDPLGGQTSIVYDAANRPTSRTNAVNQTATFAYDARGNLTSSVEATGTALARTTSHSYDSKGQRLTTTDARGNISVFTYDVYGNRLTARNALGHTTTYTYDTAGRVLTETDPDARVTTRTYDALGRVLTVTDGEGGVTRATYDAVGNRLTAVDPLNRTTTYQYDSRNLPIRITDPLGKATITEYDLSGNRITVTDPLNNTARFTYDANNRLSSSADPLGNTTSYGYDQVGNQTAVTDALNRTTSYQYDALNRLTQVTDALGGRATYGYDAIGNRTSSIDPRSNVSRITYDALNRPVSQIDPLTLTYAYQYDATGNLLSKIDGNGISTTYVYDNANRLTQANYPEGAVQFQYDGAGNRTRVTDTTGVTTYTYDRARRLTANNARGEAVAYQYDAAGNLTRMTYPGSQAVAYQYDAMNRVLGVTGWDGLTSGFTYDAAGRRVTASHPNGTRGIYDYDAAGRITSIRWTTTNGNPVTSFAYTYDGVGNTTRIADGRGISSFAYDRLDRLTNASYPDYVSTQYEYDPAGNRTSMNSGGTITFYNYDAANRLLSAGSDTMSWDGNGNMIRKGAAVYNYDSQNRLINYNANDVSNPQVIQYIYDAANRRVSRSAAGAVTSYGYDEHTQLARVVKEANSQRSQLYGLDGQVLWDASSDQGMLYYHQDALGSTAALTRADGTVAGTRTYDVFGMPRQATSATPGSFWFAGEQYDPETKLIYLRARYYDPTLGRFLQSDPVAGDPRSTQALNPYVYGLNNPLRYTDPSGESAIDDLLGSVKFYDNGGYDHHSDTKAPTKIVDLGFYVHDHTEQAVKPDDKKNQSGLLQSYDTGVSYSIVNYGNTIMTSDMLIHDPIQYVVTGLATKFFSGVFAIECIRAQLPGGRGCLNEIKMGSELWDKCMDQALHNFGKDCDTNPARGSTTGQSTSSSAGQAALAGSLASGSISYQTAYAIAAKMNPAKQPSGSKGGTGGGAPAPLGNRPSAPALQAPYNWFQTIGTPPTLQWSMCGSPDQRPVNYSQVHVYLPGGSDIYHNSGWIQGTSYVPQGLPYRTFSWTVVCMDDRGLVSGEADRWNFSIADPTVRVTRLDFTPLEGYDLIAINACTEGGAGLNVTLRASVNTDPTGGRNGEWRIIKELGVPCFNDTDRPQWYTPPFADGQHLVRVEAFRQNIPSENASSLHGFLESSYTLPHRKPASPALVSPASGVFTYTRDIAFQWQPAVNATGYRLFVSTNSDPMVSSLVDQVLPAGTTAYTATFPANQHTLYWKVRATNDVGYNDSAINSFGIDNTTPTGSVTALSGVSAQTIFLVKWTAADDYSGVDCKNIQVKDGANGVWADWFACTTLNLSAFQGQDGHTYSFRGRAKDNSGNLGAFASDTGDTSIRVEVAPANVWWHGAYKYRRPLAVTNNHSDVLPAGYVMRLRFDGATNPTSVDLYDKSASANKCDDLRVLLGDRDELDRLVLKCTTTEIDLLFRLMAPVPAASQDLTNYSIYFGNAAAVSPPADRNDVLYPAIDATAFRVYDMLEGSGLVLGDASGHINASVSTEMGWERQGKFGPALVFPGDQTPEPRPAVYAGTGAQPSGAFSVEMWVKRQEHYGGQLANQEGGGGSGWRWFLGLDGDRLFFRISPPPGSSEGVVYAQTQLSANTFFTNYHHIAVTFDGVNQVRFFIDGGLDATRTMPGVGIRADSMPLRIGNNAYQNGRFSGRMSGFAWTPGVRNDFSYGQFASVTAEPSVMADTEYFLTNPLPTPTPLPAATATPTVATGVVDGGTGADGSLVLASPGALDNKATTATGNAGSVTLSVGTTSGYTTGDEVFIHQTRGDGHYQFARVQSVGSGVLTLQTPIITSFTSGAQVARVPNYTTVTIGNGGVLTSQPWDGNKGGLLVFRASGNVTVQNGGRIDVSGLGYRGGAGRSWPCSFGDSAQQGEGWEGIGIYSNIANGSGGGGGRRTDIDGGGGGGGYGSAGGNAQWGSATGGTTVGAANLGNMFFGGGGGGSACSSSGAVGASGGGAIFAIAPNIFVNQGGGILSHGAPGQTNGASAGSGGGAGGAVFLRAGSLHIGSDQVRAEGGGGGAGGANYGGSGGLGRVHLEYVNGTGTTYPVAHTSGIPGYSTPTPQAATATPGGPTATPTNTPISTATPTPTATPSVIATTVNLLSTSDASCGDMRAIGSNWPVTVADVNDDHSPCGRPNQLYARTGYHVKRGFVSFDTSGIPAGAQITSANIELEVSATSFANDDGTTLELVAGLQGPILEPADFDAVGTTSFASRALSSFSQGAMNTVQLNAAGISAINRSGVTRFALRLGRDLYGPAPTGNNGFNTAYYNGPYGITLNITYELPAPTPANTPTPTATATSTPTPTPTPPPFGDGRDGDLVVSGGQRHNVARAAAAGPAGGTSVQASYPAGPAFAAGQKVIIHQTRGTNAGVWEFNEIQSVGSGVIAVTRPLSNTYNSDTGANRAQIMHLPQYRDVSVPANTSLIAPQWALDGDGHAGGILAFLASGNVTISGTLDGSGWNGYFGVGGQHFYGYANNANCSSDPGYQGEGTGGARIGSTGPNGNGGGGGPSGQGGGGGGNGTAGQASGGQGGLAVGTADLSVMNMGGAGGGGGRIGSGCGSWTGSGGNGAGIVLVFGNNIQIIDQGEITANGAEGYTPDLPQYGGGGGAAGGSILLKGQTVSIGTNRVVALGGTGGATGGTGTAGGAGGVGRIRIVYTGSLSGVSNPAASVASQIPPTPTPTVTSSPTFTTTPATPTPTLNPNPPVGVVQRASLATGGGQGNNASNWPAVSANGRYVAFASASDNLVTGDTNNQWDVFVYDRHTRQTSRVSVATGGTQGNGPSGSRSDRLAISDDGRYVAFESDATNLVAGDANGKGDVFVHDRQTGQTSRVSLSSAGAESDGSSLNPHLSPDGRYVIFESNATNLMAGITITGGRWNIYLHDRQTAQTSLLTSGTGGAQADGDSSWGSASAEGRYVAFQSTASNLISGDTNGYRDIYLLDRNAGAYTRLSVAPASAQSNWNSDRPVISANGRYVAFQSGADNLVAGDTNGVWDVFVRDLATGTTSRESVATGGVQASADGFNPSVSADGRYLTFQSAASELTGGSPSPIYRVFLRDRAAGWTTQVSRALSPDAPNGESWSPAVSADGSHVGFYSFATNLVQADTNGYPDAFVWANQDMVADLSISKAATGQVYPGAALTYTLSFTNSGTITATGVSVVDTPWGGAPVTVSVGTLAPGASGSQNVSITVPVTATCGSAFTNTVQISSDTLEGDYTNNQAEVVSPLACVDLSLGQTVAGDPYAGATITVTISYQNPGSVPALGTALTLTLPSGAAFQTATGAVNRAGQDVIWDGLGTLAAGGSGVQTVTVQIANTATHGSGLAFTSTVASAINDTNLSNNWATSVVTVTAQAPSIAVAVTPTGVVVGQPATLQFTITNPNANDSLSGLAFNSVLPATLVVAGSPNLSNTCGGTATASGSSISLVGGSLANSQSCTVNVDVVSPIASSYNVQTGPVSSTQTGAGGASNAATLTVGKADTAVAITGHTPSPSAPGQTVTVSFTVSVSSPGAGVPTGVVTVTNGVASCTGAVSSGSCQISLGTSGVHQLTATYAGDSNYNASVSSAVTHTVYAPPTIAIDFAPASVVVGQPATLHFTLANPNTTGSPLTGISFAHNLPANLVIANPPGTSNTCTGVLTATAGAGTITLSGSALAPGQTCSIAVNVLSMAAGAYPTQAGPISATESGTGAASNTATLTVNQASTTTTITSVYPNPSGEGHPVIVYFGVDVVSPGQGSPTGIVTVTNGIVTCSGPATAGQCRLVMGGRGMTALTATYSGDANLLGSASPAYQQVVYADPELTQEFTPSFVVLGATSTLRLAITNPNAHGPLSGIGFTGELPDGLVVANPSSLANTCGGTVVASTGGRTITLAGGGLAAGQVCTVSLQVIASEGGSYINQPGAPVSAELGVGQPPAPAEVRFGPPRDFYPPLPVRPVDPSLSSLVVSPASLVADGTSTVTITVTLRDIAGNPAVGKPVLLGTNRGTLDQIATPSGETNTAGVFTTTLRSRMWGTATIRAYVSGDDVYLTEARVVFR